MRKFRHQNLMDTLGTPCPPPDFTLRETIAFRWVFERIDDERNFMPQYLKKPERFIETADKVKCQAIGLSVFDSAGAAKDSFEKFRQRRKLIAAQLGSHIAEGNLIGLGVSDNPNNTGHFTFHPYEAIDLAIHFNIIDKL